MAGRTCSLPQLQHRCQAVRGGSRLLDQYLQSWKWSAVRQGSGLLQILDGGMFVLTWIDDLRYVLIRFCTEGLFHLQHSSASASFGHRRFVAKLIVPTLHCELPFTPPQVISR